MDTSEITSDLLPCGTCGRHSITAAPVLLLSNSQQNPAHTPNPTTPQHDRYTNATPKSHQARHTPAIQPAGPAVTNSLHRISAGRALIFITGGWRAELKRGGPRGVGRPLASGCICRNVPGGRRRTSGSWKEGRERMGIEGRGKAEGDQPTGKERNCGKEARLSCTRGIKKKSHVEITNDS